MLPWAPTKASSWSDASSSLERVKLLSSVLIVSVITTMAPRARAQAATAWEPPIFRRDVTLVGPQLPPALSIAQPRITVPTPFAMHTTDARLSSGAKTAIIVGAIVVGVLLIAGVVVVVGPGKRHL